MIAKCGTISQAAENLFRTQSAITRTLRDLEHTLSTVLFERHASGMLLTEQGHCLLLRAKRSLAELYAIPHLLTPFKHREALREEAEPIWLFNFRRLQIFLSIYSLHHTKSVASSLGISQPAVSTALKMLEKGAGIPLFQRTPKGMMPTNAAREMAPYISRALNEMGRIEEELKAQDGTLQGTVAIGTLPLCRSSLLPQAICRLLALHPAIKIVTNESAFSALVTSLRASDIDMILGALRPEAQVLDIENQAIFSEELILVTRTGHPLAGKTLTASDFSHIQWILPRKGTPSRQLLDFAFQRQGLSAATSAVETGDLAIIRGLLLHSDMVAAVSSHQLAWELQAGVLQALPFDLPDTRRDIGLMLRQGALHAPAAQALMACIKAVAENTASVIDD